MDGFEFEIRFGSLSRRLTVPSTSVTLGRSSKCMLVVPIGWIAERHLIVQACSPFARAKLLVHPATATVDGIPIRDDWAAVRPGGEIRLAGPGTESLSVRVFAIKPQEAPVVVRKGADRPGTPDDFGMILATESPIEISGGWSTIAAPDRFDAPVASPPLPTESRPPRRHGAWLAGAGLFAALLIVAAIAFNIIRASIHHRQSAADLATVEQAVDHAQASIRKGEYLAARDELTKARALAVKWPSMTDQVAQIDVLINSDAIRFGSNGMSLFEGKWVSTDRAHTYTEVRTRDAPKLQALAHTVRQAADAGAWADARTACESALALIRAEPDEIKPHDQLAFFENQLKVATSQIDQQRLASERQGAGTQPALIHP